MTRIVRVLWFGAGWFYLGISSPLILIAKYLYNHNRVQASYRLAGSVIKNFSKLMFYISGSRLSIKGYENIPQNEPVLFVSNHQGHMDSLIIQGFINNTKGFIPILEYKKVPILGTWMELMGCVFIDRTDIRKSYFAINQAAKNLSEGHSMVVFPEGKLNDGKETLEFQKGWIRIVTKSKVPIVPITLSNTHKIVSYNGKKIRPARVECIISKPIITSNLKRVDELDFIQYIREVIQEKLKKIS